MRFVFPLLLLTSPASAWEFSPSPICTLRHAQPDIAVEVTYDGALYAIHLTRPGRPWPEAPVFAIGFAPFGPTISTPRHQVDGDRLTVTDTGFGNVLRGLEGNAQAVAMLGSVQAGIDLSGAAPEVAEFRACTETQFLG
jgi:hypothetical protein